MSENRTREPTPAPPQKPEAEREPAPEPIAPRSLPPKKSGPSVDIGPGPGADVVVTPPRRILPEDEY